MLRLALPIVIALAARNLPKEHQKKAIVWGTVGAIVVRSAMTLVVVWLLRIPGLMAIGGIALMSVGMLFKVSAVPFHSWTPDVYQGAPTAVTGFMAACTKIAAFGAMLRLFYVAFGGAERDWTPMIWVIAILTMAVGSLFALSQTDIKRMLAYSTIAHAGYMMMAVAAAVQLSGSDPAGAREAVTALVFYLGVYVFMNLGAFAIVAFLRNAIASGNYAVDAALIAGAAVRFYKGSAT